MEATSEDIHSFLYKIDSVLIGHGKPGPGDGRLYLECGIDGTDFPAELADLWRPYHQPHHKATFNARINRHFGSDQYGSASVMLNCHLPLLSPDPSRLPEHHTASLVYLVSEKGLSGRQLTVGRSITLLGQTTRIQPGPPTSGKELELVGQLLTQKVVYP